MPATILLLLLSNQVVLCAQGILITIPATSYEVIDGATGKIKITISVSEFLISQTEVTQKQFKEVVGYNPSRYKGDKRPVENVSWFEAIKYCNMRSAKEGLEPCYNLGNGECNFSKNGYRLLTNTEWTVAAADLADKLDREHANIGLDSTRSSRDLMKLVNEKGTKKVASYPANKFGLYDMLGNVWEWCYDYYNEAENFPIPSLKDPTGPSWGVERVIRGGSFVSVPYILRLHNQRYRSLRPDYKSRFTGFRVCRSTKRAERKEAKVYDPNWFQPYNIIPEGFEGRGELPSLLTDADGSAITTIEQWEKKRAQLKQKWLKRLGIPPKPEHEPTVEVVETIDEEIYTGKIIYLQWDTDLRIKIFLMVPKKPVRTPAPAVLVPYYDVDASAGKNLGGYHLRDLSELKGFGYLMVQHGFIAVPMKFWLLTDESYEESMANLKLRYPDCLGLGRAVWNAQQVVDYLHTLSYVDHENIGMIGHCAGGIMTMYCAAFEERIKAAAASGPNCLISRHDTNYWDYWYLGEETYKIIDKSEDQQELVAIMAPRPFLLALGKGNTIDACFPFANIVREVYCLYGEPQNIGYIYDREGRGPSPKTTPLMRDWLIHFLGD